MNVCCTRDTVDFGECMLLHLTWDLNLERWWWAEVMLKEGVRRGMPQRNPYKEALRGTKFVIQYYIFFCSFFSVLYKLSLGSVFNSWSSLCLLLFHCLAGQECLCQTKIRNIYFLNACLHCYLNSNKLAIFNTVMFWKWHIIFYTQWSENKSVSGYCQKSHKCMLDLRLPLLWKIEL